MIITSHIGGRDYRFDLSKPVDISIPLDFHGQQPNLYGVEPARASAFQGGEWVGDTRRGGSVNFESVALTPHCNGTHTECVGHLTDERFYVHRCLQQTLLPATLVSLEPVPAADAPDTYYPALQDTDLIFTKRQLDNIFTWMVPGFDKALVIRSLPNGPQKKTAAYTGAAPFPPFFSLQGMETIAESEVQHLVVDFPSVDRLQDDGRLTNHRNFWNLPSEGHATAEEQRTTRSITELVYIPPTVEDGNYLLQLSVPPFLSDAAPASVKLFPPVQ